MDGRVSQLVDRVESLEKRIALYEEKNTCGDGKAGPQHVETEAIKAGKTFSSTGKGRVEKDLVAQGSKSHVFALVTKDYYGTPLESRRAQLGAPTVHHLCKSLVMENTKCTHTNCDDPLNSRYYMLVVQYTAKVNGDKLQKAIRKVSVPALSKSNVNMRLVDEKVSDELTGFMHNSVAPFGCTNRIPIILAESITSLNPNDFWMGGGEVDVKLRMSVKEFIQLSRALVLDITDDATGEDMED